MVSCGEEGWADVEAGIVVAPVDRTHATTVTVQFTVLQSVKAEGSGKMVEANNELNVSFHQQTFLSVFVQKCEGLCSMRTRARSGRVS
jgi:hypothetical protein